MSDNPRISSLISPPYRKSAPSSCCFTSRTAFNLPIISISLLFSPDDTDSVLTFILLAFALISSLTLSQAIILPSLIMAARPQCCWTSERICDDRKMVAPSRLRSFRIVKNSRCISGSSPPVGSSRIYNSGLCCKAHTMATFLRLPKESSLIFLFLSSLSRSQSFSASLLQSFFLRSAESLIISLTFSP